MTIQGTQSLGALIIKETIYFMDTISYNKAIEDVQDFLRETSKNLLLKNTKDDQKLSAFHMSVALNTAAIHIKDLKI